MEANNSLELSGSDESVAAIEDGRLPPPNSAEGLSESDSDSSIAVIPVTARRGGGDNFVAPMPRLEIDTKLDQFFPNIPPPPAPRRGADFRGFSYGQEAAPVPASAKPSVVCLARNSGIDVSKLFDPKKLGLGIHYK